MISKIPRAVQAGFAIAVVLGVLVGAGYLLGPLFGGGAGATVVVPPRPAGAPTGINPIAAENALVGTTAWRIANVAASAGIEGYANRVSASVGDTVNLYVSTSAAHFIVQAYRMGYYGGLGGRLVWTSAPQRGVVQAGPVVQPGTNMVSAPWHPSLSVPITPAWTPGDYLLKLVGTAGQQRYVPLTVVDYSSTAPLVIENSVATWEADNNWGGYNQYNGPDGTLASRSRIVSFDRPYPSAGSGASADVGAADFLSDEFPLVYFAESYGLDVTYLTDIDLASHGARVLAHHNALITLGHDEFWSQSMRSAVTTARDGGLNVAFLGANAVFRQIRLQPSPLGPDREIVDYQDAAEDPLTGKDNATVTVNWRDPPVNNPESSLVGELFECSPVRANAVVVDASSWLFANTGVANGDSIPNLVGPFYDRVDLAYPTPANIEVLAHSPVSCPGVGKSYSDMTYYSAASGAGVFATGTTDWVCEILALCPGDPRSHPDPRILQITKNLLFTFAAGPAGLAHPSTSNLAALHIEAPPKR